VIALVGALGRLHFPQQRIHLRQRELAVRPNRGVTGDGRQQLVRTLDEAACGAVLAQIREHIAHDRTNVAIGKERGHLSHGELLAIDAIDLESEARKVGVFALGEIESPAALTALSQALRSQDMYLAGSFLMFLAVLTVVGVFLSDLALDPPQGTGAEAGPPHLDEDYLILSTIHSAKGQEWDAVYVLNVADGSFPSEFATGRPEQIEEERRLLYVAMTRAKTSLDLVAPVKYFVTQQARGGDRHVYGARSRFLTASVMARFESLAWSDETTTSETHSQGRNVIDVAAKLRGMW